MFDASIAAALGDINAAVIVQQLNYWINKDGVGTVIDGVRYVYNTFVNWVNQQFPWLSVWQFRKAMSLLRSLGIVKVIRHKAKQWNQTNFYTLDCVAKPCRQAYRLAKFLESKNATSIETKQLCVSSPQDENNQLLELRDSELSYIESKSTYKKEQQSKVAATFSEVKKIESDSTRLSPVAHSSASPAGKKENTSSNKQNTGKDKSSTEVEQLINLKWKEQIRNLDSAGIPVNKTLIGLLKTHKPESVEKAIALFKSRKRAQYIPNPGGYFTEALRQNWAKTEGSLSEVDTADLFRYWYDLAKELGYCSGQETRDGEQWVCLSGSWEKWSKAVERGYSVDYLKKIIKRNEGRS